MIVDKLLLKDQLFNEETIKTLTYSIKQVYDFDDVSFYNDIINKMNDLELKQRVTLIREQLEKYLPNDYHKSVLILLKSLKTNQNNRGFVFASYPEFIEFNGCNKDNLKLSLEMLGEYTKWFSSEFAIRRFLIQFPEETYTIMLKWSKSEHVEQRRLASEGLRPRLPWGKNIDMDYQKASKPLYNLYFDSDRYVIRSVANHLNDISKFDPDFVVKTLKKWKNSNKQNETEMNYLINHALRTSIKRGDVKSLEMIGFNQSINIVIKDFEIKNNSIIVGESINFSFDIISNKDENVMIDYIITYPRPNNKKSEKVFKLKQIYLEKNKLINVTKSYFFRIISTRKLYTGIYTLTLQINGKRYNQLDFFIKV
jgi:3-methyladenine DNA glycosylase AlkC